MYFTYNFTTRNHSLFLNFRVSLSILYLVTLFGNTVALIIRSETLKYIFRYRLLLVLDFAPFTFCLVLTNLPKTKY